MERFRQLGPEKRAGVRAGFVDYLSLTDEQRHAAYRARLEEAMRAHPEDAGVKVQYLKLLLADGHGAEAVAAARALTAARPGGAVLADAGRALLAGGQYAAAKEILQQARTPESEADLEIAAHLARAGALDGTEAAAELEKALAAAPDRPELYRTAGGILAGKGRPQEARRLLDRAATRFPNDRGVLLADAVSAALAGDAAAAEGALGEIQKRWPEWHAAWAARGAILARAGRLEEARRALDTAVALGASGSEVSSAQGTSYLLTFFR
jgi:Flp pilus assembly protein TadD